MNRASNATLLEISIIAASLVYCGRHQFRSLVLSSRIVTTHLDTRLFEVSRYHRGSSGTYLGYHDRQ